MNASLASEVFAPRATKKPDLPERFTEALIAQAYDNLSRAKTLDMQHYWFNRMAHYQKQRTPLQVALMEQRMRLR
jgi:hypothetical protein